MKKIIILLMFLVFANVLIAQEYSVNENTSSLIAENSIEAQHKWYNNKVENDKPVLYHTMQYNGYSTPKYHNSYSPTAPVKAPSYNNSNSYKPYKPTYSNSYSTKRY